MLRPEPCPVRRAGQASLGSGEMTMIKRRSWEECTEAVEGMGLILKECPGPRGYNDPMGWATFSGSSSDFYSESRRYSQLPASWSSRLGCPVALQSNMSQLNSPANLFLLGEPHVRNGTTVHPLGQARDVEARSRTHPQIKPCQVDPPVPAESRHVSVPKATTTV